MVILSLGKVRTQKEVNPNYSGQLTIFTNPSARAGYDTRSVFKRSWTGFNSEFSYLLLYCHLQHHNDTIIKTQEDFFNKIFTSHFIARVRKKLLKVCVWEGVRDRTELKYFDPHSYGRQRYVFLVLKMLNRRPWGPLCWVLAFFTASYQQLLWSPNSIGVPEGPLGRVWLFLPHLVYNSVSNCLEFQLDSVFTELYNSSTPTRSPTRSLKSHVWSSSSRNNCHAVHRSLSSGASVYECTMGIFYLVPFHQPI